MNVTTNESLGTVAVRSLGSGILLTPLSAHYNVFLTHSLVTTDDEGTTQNFWLQDSSKDQSLRDELDAWDAASDEAWGLISD